MTKILLMLTMTKERCSSWFGSRVQELSCSDIAGSADDSYDDGDVDHDDVGHDDDDDEDGAERKMQVFKSWFKS